MKSPEKTFMEALGNAWASNLAWRAHEAGRTASTACEGVFCG